MKDFKNFLGGENLGVAVENIRNEYNKTESRVLISSINSSYGTKFKK